MTTEFGKICRKIRVDNGEVLKDMAAKLGVTTAYLSAVEIGKRNIPEGWSNIIKENYKLNEKRYEELLNAVYAEKKTLKVDLLNYNDEDKELIIEFVRNIEKFTERDKREIKSIIQKRKSNGGTSRWESFLD